jgi:hypothetical protein
VGFQPTTTRNMLNTELDLAGQNLIKPRDGWSTTENYRPCGPHWYASNLSKTHIFLLSLGSVG